MIHKRLKTSVVSDKLKLKRVIPHLDEVSGIVGKSRFAAKYGMKHKNSVR